MTSLSNAWGSLNQIVYDFGCAHVFFLSFFFCNDCNWHELSDHMGLTCFNCQDWLKEELNILGVFLLLSLSAWKARSRVPLKLLEIAKSHCPATKANQTIRPFAPKAPQKHETLCALHKERKSSRIMTLLLTVIFIPVWQWLHALLS